MIEKKRIIAYLTLLELSLEDPITQDLLEKNYARLSQVYHPDVAHKRYSDGKKFIELKEAKDYLKLHIIQVNELILNKFTDSLNNSKSDFHKLVAYRIESWKKALEVNKELMERDNYVYSVVLEGFHQSVANIKQAVSIDQVNEVDRLFVNLINEAIYAIYNSTLERFNEKKVMAIDWNDVAKKVAKTTGDVVGVALDAANNLIEGVNSLLIMGCVILFIAAAFMIPLNYNHTPGMVAAYGFAFLGTLIGIVLSIFFVWLSVDNENFTLKKAKTMRILSLVGVVIMLGLMIFGITSCSQGPQHQLATPTIETFEITQVTHNSVRFRINVVNNNQHANNIRDTNFSLIGIGGENQTIRNAGFRLYEIVNLPANSSFILRVVVNYYRRDGAVVSVSELINFRTKRASFNSPVITVLSRAPFSSRRAEVTVTWNDGDLLVYRQSIRWYVNGKLYSEGYHYPPVERSQTWNWWLLGASDRGSSYLVVVNVYYVCPNRESRKTTRQLSFLV